MNIHTAEASKSPSPRRAALLTVLFLLEGVLLAIQVQNNPVLQGHFLQQIKPKTLMRSSQSVAQSKKKIRIAGKNDTFSRLIRTIRNTAGIPAGTLPFVGGVHLAAPKTDALPVLTRTHPPVSRIPDWGSFRTPSEWNRTYAQMPRNAFVRIPPYRIDALTTPAEALASFSSPETAQALMTAKLFYSTRFFATYDLDAAEFTGNHPGIDLKLALGTPVASIGDGKVHAVHREKTGLGNHVMIEHVLPNGDRFISIYGHLDSIAVQDGEQIEAGDIIGTAGDSGNASAPHLHLQIDRVQEGETDHKPYWPDAMPTPNEANRYTVHPWAFIQAFADPIEVSLATGNQ